MRVAKRFQRNGVVHNVRADTGFERDAVTFKLAQNRWQEAFGIPFDPLVVIDGDQIACRALTKELCEL